MKSIIYEPRPALRATEARLEAIYNAAKKGLKGDNLALASGMLPEEYRRLCQNDPVAEYAEMKGRADGELAASEQLHAAAAAGDYKAALAILQHAHGWVAKQQLQVTQTTISITAALEQAQQRLEHAETNLRLGGRTVIDVEAVEPRGRS
jgi:hypothetical protein